MAKFCECCGKQLKEWETCSCYMISRPKEKKINEKKEKYIMQDGYKTCSLCGRILRISENCMCEHAKPIKTEEKYANTQIEESHDIEIESKKNEVKTQNNEEVLIRKIRLCKMSIVEEEISADGFLHVTNKRVAFTSIRHWSIGKKRIRQECDIKNIGGVVYSENPRLSFWRFLLSWCITLLCVGVTIAFLSGMYSAGGKSLLIAFSVLFTISTIVLQAVLRDKKVIIPLIGVTIGALFVPALFYVSVPCMIFAGLAYITAHVLIVIFSIVQNLRLIIKTKWGTDAIAIVCSLDVQYREIIPTNEVDKSISSLYQMIMDIQTEDESIYNRWKTEVNN